jgi:hypothetical protein
MRAGWPPFRPASLRLSVHPANLGARDSGRFEGATTRGELPMHFEVVTKKTTNGTHYHARIKGGNGEIIF